MRKLKPLILNLNSAYFTGHQGIQIMLICACMNRTGGHLRTKGWPIVHD